MKYSTYEEFKKGENLSNNEASRRWMNIIMFRDHYPLKNKKKNHEETVRKNKEAKVASQI